MKPLISYYGGKQRMASKIVPLIPKHTVYVEPFAGGAAVLFAKPLPNITNGDHYREVINDTSRDLINLYEMAFTHPEELARLIESTLYSRDAYRRTSELLNNNAADRLLRAWAYYVNIHQSFSNKLEGGWGRGVYGQNHAASWANKKERLRQTLRRLDRVYIDSTDAIECIRRWDSPQTFFYVDPPYVGTEQGHYRGYTSEQYQQLFDALMSCAGSFLLSCYDAPGVSAPASWKKHIFQSYCSASGQGKIGASRNKSQVSTGLGRRERTEVLYARGPTAPLRPDLEKLLNSGKFDCFTGDSVPAQAEMALCP